jgi:hypothetical protein
MGQAVRKTRIEIKVDGRISKYAVIRLLKLGFYPVLYRPASE